MSQSFILLSRNFDAFSHPPPKKEINIYFCFAPNKKKLKMKRNKEWSERKIIQWKWTWEIRFHNLCESQNTRDQMLIIVSFHGTYFECCLQLNKSIQRILVGTLSLSIHSQWPFRSVHALCMCMCMKQPEMVIFAGAASKCVHSFTFMNVKILRKMLHQ